MRTVFTPGSHATIAAMFTLAHISDVHLGPMPAVAFRDLLSKRMLGYANWRRSRSVMHRAETLATIVNHVRGQNPDHIAVTGDLVNLALPGEFQTAREWLDALGDPGKVSVVPGNHDAYVAVPLGAGFECWAPFMTSDDGDRTKVEFPFLRRRGAVSLIGASSAVPAPIFKAFGRLGQTQIRALRRLLTAEGQAGRFRILMIHHPPHPQGARARKRLVDSRDLLAVLRETGVELVIYGHNHRFDLSWHPGPKGLFPAVCVPSGSVAAKGTTPKGGYHLFKIPEPGAETAVQLCRYSADTSGNVRQIGETLSLGGPDQTTVAALLRATAPQA